jgi:hypothetical protein
MTSKKEEKQEKMRIVEEPIRQSIGFGTPSKFVVKISNCGNDFCSATYGKLEDENASQLVFRAVNIMASAIGGKEMAATIRYQVAAKLLSTIKGWELEKLKKDIETCDSLSVKFS